MMRKIWMNYHEKDLLSITISFGVFYSSVYFSLCPQISLFIMKPNMATDGSQI